MAGPRIDPSLYRDRDVVPIRRALVSVSDKTDLLVLAEALVKGGVEIVSTGSTAATIRCPVASPIEPPMKENRKSITTTGKPNALAVPQTTLSSLCERSRARSSCAS